MADETPPTIAQDFEAVQEAVNAWWRSEGGHQKQAALGRIAQSHDELVAALEGVLTAALRLDGHDAELYSDEIAAARAALAKAKGAAP